MIKAQLDEAISANEQRNERAMRLLADITDQMTVNDGQTIHKYIATMTEKVIRRENALQCIRRVREDMDMDPDRVEALEWLLDSLKITGVIR